MELYFTKDEDLKLNSITNIVLHVIFYVNKNKYKFWSILTMFIYLKKNVCWQGKHRTVLSSTYCYIYEILFSNDEESGLVSITTIVPHVLFQTHKNNINFRTS
jgi:hypothetical protein